MLRPCSSIGSLYSGSCSARYLLSHLVLMMPSAPRPPVMTHRPGPASCAGLSGAGGAVVTTLPIARAADSCRRPAAASASGYASGASGLMAPAGLIGASSSAM